MRLIESCINHLKVDLLGPLERVKKGSTCSARAFSVVFSEMILMSCTPAQSENNYFTEMCSGSEAGSYLRLIDFCIT